MSTNAVFYCPKVTFASLPMYFTGLQSSALKRGAASPASPMTLTFQSEPVPPEQDVLPNCSLLYILILPSA